MKKIQIYFLLSIFFITNISYAFSIEPDIFIQSTVNRASKVLSNNISKEQKIDELKLIAKDTVFIEKVASYSLGSFRKTLTNKQKNKVFIFI